MTELTRRQRITRRILRIVRGAGWGGAAGLAIYEADTLRLEIIRLDMSAPQAAAAAGVVLARMLAVYICARAFDRILALAERTPDESSP